MPVGYNTSIHSKKSFFRESLHGTVDAAQIYSIIIITLLTDNYTQ